MKHREKTKNEEPKMKACFTIGIGKKSYFKRFMQFCLKYKVNPVKMIHQVLDTYLETEMEIQEKQREIAQEMRQQAFNKKDEKE